MRPEPLRHAPGHGPEPRQGYPGGASRKGGHPWRVEIQFAEATIDNGRFGTRTVRFETGRLARQAAGSVAAYLDDETMLLSATTAGKHPKEQFDFFP